MVWPSGKQGTLSALLQETGRTSAPGGEWKRERSFLGMKKGNIMTLGINFPLYPWFFPSFNSDPHTQFMGGRHKDRFPFYGEDNDSIKRRQSPAPISVNVSSLCYLKHQPIRVTLFFQCDGEAISLPNLQGIVVLNITSYAGGVNFWGSSTATTVSMEQGTERETGLTPLKSIRKES